MVTINKLQIDSLASQIDVHISTEPGTIFTKVYAWKASNFKDYSKALDLSHLLDGSTEEETFTVFSVENLLESNISGLWFFEFMTDEEVSTSNSNVAIGVVSNLVPYYDFLTTSLLQLEVEGCGPKLDPNCSECQKGHNTLFYINSLLTSFKYTTQNGYYEEAAKIQELLEDATESCDSCSEYTDTLLINGLGFATINNVITPNFD